MEEIPSSNEGGEDFGGDQEEQALGDNFTAQVAIPEESDFLFIRNLLKKFHFIIGQYKGICLNLIFC